MAKAIASLVSLQRQVSYLLAEKDGALMELDIQNGEQMRRLEAILDHLKVQERFLVPDSPAMKLNRLLQGETELAIRAERRDVAVLTFIQSLWKPGQQIVIAIMAVIKQGKAGANVGAHQVVQRAAGQGAVGPAQRNVTGDGVGHPKAVRRRD